MDSYGFLSSSSDKIVKAMHHYYFKILKKEFPDKGIHLKKKLAYPYEHFKSLCDYQETVDSLKKEDFFIKLKTKNPDDEKTERTKKDIKMFDIKNGEELTQLYLKSDVILLADIFEKFVRVSIEEFDIIPLY